MRTHLATIDRLEARIAPATFVVNTINDSSDAPNNPGHIVSLRDALALADAHGGTNNIVFDLPASDMVNGAFTITLSSLGTLTSNGNVNISGPGAGSLIINGGNKYGVFDFNDGKPTTDSPVTISGLSIVYGKSSSGGAIYSTESLTLKNVTISGNTSTQSNGGIYVSGNASAGTTVSISHSLITDNSAADFSGGMGLAKLKSFTMTDTVLSGNTAVSNGGGGAAVDITDHGHGITITNCQILGNTGNFGAGLKLEDLNTAASSKITIKSTTITGNVSDGAGLGGGAVYVGQGNTVITGSTIRDNTAVYDGGGIDAQSFASLTIASTTFTANQTTRTNAPGQGGGGIFIEGNGSGTLQPVSITASDFFGNRSASSGGGLYALDSISLTLSHATFSANNAAGAGGGVGTYGVTEADRVDVTVHGGLFSGNSSGPAGGGIFALGAGRVVIIASKVTGNVSVDGGGICVGSFDPTGGLIMKNVVATGNFAANYGGGLDISDDTAFHVSGGSMTGNSAAGEGGGININDATGSIEGVIISGNSAGFDGGGVYHTDGGVVTLQVADVTANSAPAGPNTGGPFTVFT